MNLRKLRRRTIRQARRERNRGNLTTRQYQTVLAVCEDETSLAELNARIEGEVNPWKRSNELIGGSWANIWANVWDWFVANWPKILDIILTIAPLLLLEPQNED